MKFSVISSFLGKSKDRFHDYNKSLSLDEKFAMAKTIENIEGLEVVFPYEVGPAKEFKALMEKYQLGVSAINVNVKAEPEFRNGGLTSSDPAVRAKAVQFIKDSKDFAAEVGADKVTCCPLGDGYEFSFQADYTKSWGYLVETFKEAAAYRPEVPLFIEYKPSETRGKCFLDNAAKTILLIKEIGLPSLGVTIDFGHSMYGGNNPAEEVALLESCKVPYYVHINDNDAKWDWDYFAGSKHIVEYVEFMYYLKKFNYNGYLTSDTSPTRWDIRKTFEANNRITLKVLSALDKMEADGFDKVLASDEYMDIWAFIEEHIFF
jgi:xylose isomerase